MVPVADRLKREDVAPDSGAESLRRRDYSVGHSPPYARPSQAPGPHEPEIVRITLYLTVHHADGVALPVGSAVHYGLQDDAAEAQPGGCRDHAGGQPSGRARHRASRAPALNP